MFSLSRTLTLAWGFASSCSTLSASACSSASLLFGWIKLLPSVQWLSASQQLTFCWWPGRVGLWSWLWATFGWSSWFILLLYFSQPIMFLMFEGEIFWSISSNHSSSVNWSSMFSSSSWISINILNIFSCIFNIKKLLQYINIDFH